MAVPLLHMITTADWKTALTAGVVAPPSLAEVGFVHLSTPEQVELPANALFAGRADVQLLVLDPARIGVEVRWEDGTHATDPGNMQFPHAYGSVPTAAVVAVQPYRCGKDGRFETPVVAATDIAGRVGRFEATLLRRVATTEVPVTGGVGVLTDAVPHSHMHNQLLVERPVDAEQLVADADTVLSGMKHRKVALNGPDQGPTAAALAERGWRTEKIVIMTAPAQGSPDARVEQVDLDDLRDHWAAMWRHDAPAMSDETIRQLAERNRIEERVVDLRYLAVRDGGVIAASCLLKIDGATAWLDAVTTDPAYRGRGHGNALIATAGALAAAAGCDVVGLGADAQDWPRTWYARHGYVEVGESWSADR